MQKAISFLSLKNVNLDTIFSVNKIENIVANITFVEKFAHVVNSLGKNKHLLQLSFCDKPANNATKEPKKCINQNNVYLGFLCNLLQKKGKCVTCSDDEHGRYIKTKA